MRKILALISIALLSTGLWAQLDRSTPPKAGPAPIINIGESHQFTLKNGLKVIVVEDHKFPLITYSLNLNIDPVDEGNATGYVQLVGDMMRAGTANRTKDQIDEEADFIGATFRPNAKGIYARSLSRHSSTLLSLMTDVLFNPVFPEDELSKLKIQMEGSIQANKNEPSAIANNIASALLYGNDPYGAIVTEESLANITVEHFKQYHDKYFRPNKAYLVIVGDITVKEAKKQAEKYFGKWKSAAVPEFKKADFPQYEGNQVAVANRDGANQSTVFVTHTVDLKPGHPDEIKVSVMNTILGGGSFSARLFRNLREEKAFTYGAYSNLSSDERIGRFRANTQVRTSVTDSAVHEILYEMKRIQDEPVSQEDLDLIKNMLTGNFSRSLEDPQTVARFALNIARYNLPEDYYRTYLEKLAAVTIEDVQEMARKYLKPENCVIIAVGEADKIAGPLSAYAADGKVKRYDYYGKEVQGLQPVSGITAEDVINTYIEALGGKEKLDAIKSWTQTGSTTVQGMEIGILNVQTAKNQVLVEMSMRGQVISKQVYNGSRGKISSPMGEQELEGQLLETMKEASYLFPELLYFTQGYKTELAGAEIIDGQRCYKLEVTKPSGTEVIVYFKSGDGLKLKEISTSEAGGTSTSTYKAWKEVDGVLFPVLINQVSGPQSLDMQINEIKINDNPGDELFAI